MWRIGAGGAWGWERGPCADRGRGQGNSGPPGPDCSERGRQLEPHHQLGRHDGQGLTLVHFSAHPEPFLTQNIPSISPTRSSPGHFLNTP